MGPFNAPEIVLDGFKERAEALAVQGMLEAYEQERISLTGMSRRQALHWHVDREPPRL